MTSTRYTPVEEKINELCGNVRMEAKLALKEIDTLIFELSTLRAELVEAEKPGPVEGFGYGTATCSSWPIGIPITNRAHVIEDCVTRGRLMYNMVEEFSAASDEHNAALYEKETTNV